MYMEVGGEGSFSKVESENYTCVCGIITQDQHTVLLSGALWRLNLSLFLNKTKYSLLQEGNFQ